MDQNHKEKENLENESKVAHQARSPGRVHTTERANEEEPITEINVTPLVDVALVLVIIFMAVSPFMLQAGLTVQESKAGAETGKHALEKNLQIRLNEENKIFVNNEEILLKNLADFLKTKIPKTLDKMVTLQAEKTNRVGQVVEILDLAKQSGALKVAILNKEKE